MITEPLLKLAKVLVPSSIVARAVTLILGISLLLTALFSIVASLVIQSNETGRLHTELTDLLAAVEQPLSVACFVNDRQLAQEIAHGLNHSKLVAGLRIIAGKDTLYERLSTEPDSKLIVISRDIVSPFRDDEVIGRLTLQASRAAISAKAWGYTRVVLVMLALGALLVAGGVAWIVSNLITRPIKSISDELHRLELRTGMHLKVPRTNRQDEIGRLVSDVNSMISTLTELVDTERQLRFERERSERQLRLVFEKADTGIFVIDHGGRLKSWNPAFARMLPDVNTGETRVQRLLAPDEARVEDLIDRAADDLEGASEEFELQPADGERRWLKISLDPLGDGHLEGVLNDVTTHRQAELSAQQLASSDPLTGLLNRRGFQAQLLARSIYPVSAHGPLTALLMMDLDYFKQVNDTYGHSAGDQVLQHVSRLLQAAVRRTDLVARTGGDEFVVALIGIDSTATAESIARNIIAAVSQPIRLPTEQTVQVGASIGIAIIGAGDASLDATLNRADQAMYNVKLAGRGTVQFAAEPGASTVA